MKAHQSRKNRERARTTRPLHRTTKATIAGYAEKVVSTLRIKPGKSNIWINEEVDLSVFGDSRAVDRATLQDSDVDVELAVEVYRADKIDEHRRRLAELCKEQNLAPPIYAWERWQARCKLRELQHEVKEMEGDEVLPRNCGAVDAGLVADLIRASFPEDIANNISAAMSSTSDTMVEEILSFRNRAIRDMNLCRRDVLVVQHKHTLDISCDGNKHKLLKLNNAHYARLQEQFRKYNADRDGNFSEILFHKRLYILLSRYRSILGHGFQAALNEHSFRVLLKYFDVKFECFASPLNSTCTSFCSAFPSVDCFFGSVGNFFKLRWAFIHHGIILSMLEVLCVMQAK